MLPAVAVIVVVPGTTNAPVWVIAPPAVTIKLPVNVEAPNAIAPASVMEAFRTDAKETVPKSFALFRRTSPPEAFRVLAAPDAVIIAPSD